MTRGQIRDGNKPVDMSASQDVGSLAQEPWHLDEPYPGMSCQSLVEQHPATSTSTYNIKNWNTVPQSGQVLKFI